MAKKKTSTGQKKGGRSGMMWLLLFAVVVIFVLVAQLQEKDRKLAKLNKPAGSEKQKDADSAVEYVVKPNVELLDKEKIQKTAEANLEKLVGRAKKPGENWFVDDVKLIKNNLVKISYEDGHTVNSVTYKVKDQNDCSTWVKQ